MKWCGCLTMSLVLMGSVAGLAAGGEPVATTEAFTFVQVADPQFGWGYGYDNDVNSLRQAVDHINGLKPDLVVICGDMVNSFNDDSVADFLEVQSGFTMPSYCAAGNHDVGNSPTVASLERYRESIGDDYFSFEHRGYTFVIVNSCLWKAPVAEESEKHDAWLRETLAAARAKNSPVFIVGHHPLYLVSPDEAEEYYNLPPAKRSELLALYEEAGVVAVLGGHRHLLLINEYKGIQLVNGETTCRHFDNSPLGFRLWHVESPTSIWHEFRPLVPETPSVDFNGDGVVDHADVCILIDHWQKDYSPCDVAPPPFGDGIVDVQDLVFLSEHLFEDYRLAACWKMDELEGTIAYDSVGLSDGVLHGDPIWRPEGGQVDGALQFDGLDDYVSTPHVLDPSEGPFSLFMWVKGGLPGQVVLSQAGTPSGVNWLHARSSEGNLASELKGIGRGNRPLISESIITDDAWHHIGLVWDGSSLSLYTDGVEVATGPQDGLPSIYGGMNIGAAQDLEAGRFWLGLIDDVRLYDEVVRP